MASVGTVGRARAVADGARRLVRVVLAVGWLLLTVVAAPQAAAAVWLQIDARTHSGPIMRLAVDAARDLVVTASDDKTARVWSLASGDPVAVLRPAVGAAQIGRLFGAAIHPTRDLVAVAGTTAELSASGHSIWLFEVSTGRFLRRVDAVGGHVRRLVWAAGGTVLFAGFEGSPAVRAFDIDGRVLLDEPFDAAVFGLAARADRVAAVARDGSVRVWRVDGTAVTPLARLATDNGDPIAIELSPDGTRVAVGYFRPGYGGDVFRVDSGERLFRLASPHGSPEDAALRRNRAIDTTQAVVWGPGERTIFTAGSLDADGRVDGRIRRYDAAGGRLIGEDAVASDTVTDLAALPTVPGQPEVDRVAWASFAGTWGTYAGGASRTLASPRVDFLVRRGAAELRVAPDGRRVRWVRGALREPVSFDLAAREAGAGATTGLREPVTRRGLFDAATNFENNTLPRVRNQTIRLETGETSRALTYVGDEGHVVIATSLGMRRLDASTRVVWQVSTATEVRAVNVTENGQVLVTSMTDGTVRWWRARDGVLLLSLLATREGWIAWAPTGHYDASHGAESLIGWLVDRADSPLPDHFTIGRFRERFHRPDVIDRVLDTLDPLAALTAADGSRTDVDAPALRPDPAAPAAAPAAPAVPAPVVEAAAPVDQIRPPAPVPLPPVLGSLEPPRVRYSPAPRTFQFTVRNEDTALPVTVEVRIDGRLVDPVSVALPARLDGSAPAQVALALPAQARLVQVVARSGDLVSEPITYAIDGDPSRRLEPLRANGTLYVVAVGVSEYANRDYQLGLPAKDARDFADAMRAQQGRLYREVVVQLLTDREATRARVLQALDWLRAQVGTDDVGMLFLAGHGLNDQGGRYHFMPHDADARRLRTTGVPDAALGRAMGRLRGRAVVFLDTCFAGEATTVFRGVSRETARVSNDLSAPENAVIVFASSAARQESLERTEWGNGAFTKVLIEGLSGGAKEPGEGVVTLRSLGPYLAREVARLTGGRQTPVSLLPEALPDRILASLGVTLQSLRRAVESVFPVAAARWFGSPPPAPSGRPAPA
jgi:WD40 repeat protein